MASLLLAQRSLATLVSSACPGTTPVLRWSNANEIGIRCVRRYSNATSTSAAPAVSQTLPKDSNMSVIPEGSDIPSETSSWLWSWWPFGRGINDAGNGTSHSAEHPSAATTAGVQSIDSVNAAARVGDLYPSPSNSANAESVESVLQSVTGVVNDADAWHWYSPVMDSIVWFHDAGFSWWAAIVLSSLVLRFVQLPFTYITVRNTARSSAVNPALQRFQDLIRQANQEGKVSEALFLQERFKQLRTKYGMSAAHWASLALQMILLVAYIQALRKLLVLEPGMSTGGLSWFVDLAAPDPYYILPVISTALVYPTFIGNAMSNLTGYARMAMIGLPVVFGLMTMKFSCAFFLHWITSSSVQATLSRMSMHNRFKHLFLPKELMDTSQLLASVQLQKARVVNVKEEVERVLSSNSLEAARTYRKNPHTAVKTDESGRPVLFDAPPPRQTGQRLPPEASGHREGVQAAEPWEVTMEGGRTVVPLAGPEPVAHLQGAWVTISRHLSARA